MAETQDDIGTPTIKAVPDLTEFTRLMDWIGDAGFEVTERTTVTYNADGKAVSTVKITAVRRRT